MNTDPHDAANEARKTKWWKRNKEQRQAIYEQREDQRKANLADRLDTIQSKAGDREQRTAEDRAAARQRRDQRLDDIQRKSDKQAAASRQRQQANQARRDEATAGLRAVKANRPSKYGPYKLTPSTIEHTPSRETHPLEDVTARVESGDALQQRITATRIVLTGVFALAWRKKRGGESWLTVEGPDFFWTEKIERGDANDAREFAAKVNNAARK